MGGDDPLGTILGSVLEDLPDVLEPVLDDGSAGVVVRDSGGAIFDGSGSDKGKPELVAHCFGVEGGTYHAGELRVASGALGQSLVSRDAVRRQLGRISYIFRRNSVAADHGRSSTH